MTKQEWEVKHEGDPTCPHERFSQKTYLSYPPTHAVQCSQCGRKIERRDAPPKQVWPEHR